MNFVEAIWRESRAFYETAATADPSRPIVSCPDWDVAALVRHLGNVHWFWASVIEARATDPGPIEAAKPEALSGYDDLLRFGREQADRLARVLHASDDSIAVWTWPRQPEHQNVAFIRRYQVQEAAVHRWDVQRAASEVEPDPIDADAASDAIHLFLDVVLPWAVDEASPLPGTVHLHCTDTEGEWFVHADGRVEPIHAKGDVAMRGSASDLLLALYERVGLDRIDVIGDRDLAATFIARCSTE